MRNIVNVKDIQGRSKNVELIEDTPFHFTARDQKSDKSTGESHKVRYVPELEGCLCDCQWNMYNNVGEYSPSNAIVTSACKHAMAVMQHLTNGILSFWIDENDAKRQHRPIIDVGQNVIATVRKPKSKSKRVNKSSAHFAGVSEDGLFAI